MRTIAILEDDQRRVAAMLNACAPYFPGLEICIFGSAAEMIAWLVGHHHDVCVISLDCDLDATALTDGDCGSGEDVSGFLAENMTNCPVVIHSSNAMRAPAMHMELTMAGCERVVLGPFRDSESWATDVGVAIGE